MSHYNYYQTSGTWANTPAQQATINQSPYSSYTGYAQSGYAGYGAPATQGYSYASNAAAPKPPAPPAAPAPPSYASSYAAPAPPKPSPSAGWGQPISSRTTSVSRTSSTGPAPGSYKPPQQIQSVSGMSSSKPLQGSLAGSFVSAGQKPRGTESVSGNTSYTGYDAAVYAAATNYLQNKSRGGNIETWSKGPKKPPYSSGGGGGGGSYGGGGGGGGSSYSSSGGIANMSKTMQKKGQYGRYGGYNSEAEKLQAMNEHYCDICKISCLGPSTYQAHVQGKQHKRKEASAKSGASMPLPPGRNSYKCDICEVTCASQDTFNAHVAGKNHQKTVRLMHQLGKPIQDANTPTIIPPKGGVIVPEPAKKVVSVSKISFVGGKNLVTGQQGSTDTDVSDPEPVGGDYVESKINEHGHTVYYCKLCACDIIDSTARDMHLKGRRHRLSYKKKVNPELEVDMKPVYGKYSPRGRKQEEALRRELMRLRQQELASMRMKYEAEMETLMGVRQQTMGRGPFPVADYLPLHTGGQFRLDLLEDKYVLSKHKDIYPSEQELTAVQRIVNHAEQALKGVSDVVEDGIKKELPENADPQQAKERLLKGVMRVGDLAKGLLLSSNLSVQIVLLCSAKPTKTLLKSLFEKMQEQLKKMEMQDVYSVQLNMSSGSITMSTKPPKAPEPATDAKADTDKEKTDADKKKDEFIKINLHIMVTSTLVRDGGSEDEDPKDMLPKAKCLEALALLRQAKWFQARCAHIQSGVMILRILRDLCQRVPTWTPLSPWALELLVEKVTSTAPAQLSVGEAFRRTFEAVAAGVLLPTGPGLLDPCEKESVDGAQGMTPQQREDITASAQHALRLIAFGQIHQVLNVEPLDPSGNRKRPHESVEKPEQKVAKTEEK